MNTNKYSLLFVVLSSISFQTVAITCYSLLFGSVKATYFKLNIHAGKIDICFYSLLHA